MNQKLPPEAYAALAALKSQAAAATAMAEDRKNDDNKRLLAKAHAQMEENKTWTLRIIKALMNGGGLLTIDSANDEWLESIFVSSNG